ncbi:hypothetical protein GCM10025864_29740 [Luteimicrobium album]|uniref:Peptide chain release factor N(5)-glutamine methyltransferase n=1 Tax=Luteimicrobium album TaxID=1054550 RepID=A0ABQ6I617_9MICO|nr:hypothetical protein GCM10025864_29740 [Luteimicrobium album]
MPETGGAAVPVPDDAAAVAGAAAVDLSARGLRGLVARVADLLEDAGVPSPRVDAEALVAWSLGLPRLEWVRLPAAGPVVGDAAAPAFLAELAEVVERRRAREPLQRIVGSTVFRHVTVRVLDDVFVPRPETEVVAQVAVDEAARLAAGRAGTDAPGPLVVDLCCGSGVIGISVDVEVPGARVVAADASEAAVRATAANAAAVGSGTQRTLVGDVRDDTLLAELDGTVDVVVSNPPYIPPTRSRATRRSATTTPTWPCTGAGRTGSRSRAPSCGRRPGCSCRGACSSWSTPRCRPPPCARRSRARVASPTCGRSTT